MLAIILLLLPTFGASLSICEKNPEDKCRSYDRMYTESEMFEKNCFMMECRPKPDGYYWFNYGLKSNCIQCKILTTKRTFDGNEYYLKGNCNYTMVQPINCSEGSGSYNPRFAVHSDFKTCPDIPIASCLNKTTIKLNESTVINIDHSNYQTISIDTQTAEVSSHEPELYCDSNSNAYEFFAWKFADWNCIVINGISFTVWVCPKELYIITPPENKNSIAGLCGFYSTKAEDDFLKRDCQTESIFNPQASQNNANSWTTLVQSEDGCIFPGQCDDPARYVDQCTKEVNNGIVSTNPTASNLINNCVSNCCKDPSNCSVYASDALASLTKLCPLGVC